MKKIKTFFLIFLIPLFCTTACQKIISTHLFKAQNILISSQDKNGSWDPEKSDGNYKSDEGIVALTSISLAALLHMPNPPKDPVKKAIKYLLEKQTEKGNIGSQNYANAIALYALAIANKKKLVDDSKILLLTNHIVSQQSNTGGWDYTQANDYRNDLSITGWVYMGFMQLKKNIFDQCKAQNSILKLNKMLEADQSGVGDTSPLAKANAYYTYGKYPNSHIGKVSRSPGATIQAIILMIRCQDQSNHPDPWTQIAIEDQIKSFDINKSYSLYKAFFNSHSHLPNNHKNNLWLAQIKQQVKLNQLKSGIWQPNDHPTKFGGYLFSTALAVIILSIH